MRFELTDEQNMIREMAADFAAAELAPAAAGLDRTRDRSLLKANLKKMAELGLMTMNCPETYGGADVGGRGLQPGPDRNRPGLRGHGRDHVGDQYGGRSHS